MRSYGCFNRPDPADRVVVQDGWRRVDVPTSYGVPITFQVRNLITVPNPMSRDCKYAQHTPDDPQCSGCHWQKGG